jgi:hypothetical protein
METKKRSRQNCSNQKTKRLNHIKSVAYKYGIAVIFILYIFTLGWSVIQIRMIERPDLGSCLIPKGTWPYEHYNNLKWVDCEIRKSYDDAET